MTLYIQTMVNMLMYCQTIKSAVKKPTHTLLVPSGESSYCCVWPVPEAAVTVFIKPEDG